MTRASAFKKPLQLGWSPLIFEEVFLPPRTPFLTASRGWIDLLLGWGLADVRYRVNGRLKKARLLITDLRPTGRILVWKGNERVFVSKATRAEWRYPQDYDLSAAQRPESEE